MYNYYDMGNAYNVSNTTDIWPIISIIIAIAAAICLYFTVFAPDKQKKYTGFMKKLYDFVKFDTMIIIPVIKIVYLVTAIYITLMSFTYISENFLEFLLFIVAGNILARIAYEFILVLLRIYENTNDINKKLK